MLNGRNFQIPLEGVVQRVGFYTTRFVEANDTEQAELQAIALVKSDEELRISVRNKLDDPSTIHLEEVVEVADFEDVQVPGAFMLKNNSQPGRRHTDYASLR